MMPPPRHRALVMGALMLLLSGRASAYTIESGFTRSCHERISLPAIEFYLLALSERGAVPLPADELWRDATGDVARALEGDPELSELLENEGLEFAVVSLLVGLREPDTDGYSVSDLNAIRSVHGNSAPRAQYAHALRAAGDEGPTGDMKALEGARDVIKRHLEELLLLEQGPAASQNVSTWLYVEHYGRIEVDVWGPAYRLGLALHVLQDSFSHSIRTEDTLYVLQVLNYVDAFQGTIHQEVDGLAHSTALDQCERSENQKSVLAASDRSVALVSAALKMTEGDDGQALLAGLSDCAPDHSGDMECGWFSYFPECEEAVREGRELSETCCSRETDFCDARLLSTILETPTRPYLKEAFGCDLGARPPRGRGREIPFVLLVLVSVFLLVRRVLREGVRAGECSLLRPLGLVLGFAGVCFPTNAEAQENYPSTFVFAVDAHASLLTDAPQESVLNISYGPALRGGYRFRGGKRAQWGVLGFVERDVWVVSDYEFRTDPGVVNLGLGVEILYFDFLRSAYLVGPSILVFDTALHEEGAVGIFSELQPLGAQFYFWDRWGLTFDPLSVAWVNPTPENGRAPSVGHLQYRTTIGLEWRSVPRR